MPLKDEWARAARTGLLACRASGKGWGYRYDAPPASEPTALASLALLAGAGAGESAVQPAVREAADWLASIQRGDGSVGPSESQAGPGWATPLAILLWRAVGGQKVPVTRAEAWLNSLKGATASPADDPRHVVGHDTTIVGWPWVANTHSWVEPTALAVLALGRGAAGPGAGRVSEGYRLLRDRALPSGGWNYGNKAVYGRPLRAQPAPTGLALLALAADSGPDELSAAACRYLLATLPLTLAAASLGWGVLGLRAWGAAPEASARWLAESHAKLSGRADAAPRTALLLLAAGAGSLALFDRDPAGGANRAR